MRDSRRPKYLAYDCETSGLSITKSEILTFAAVTLDENLEIIKSIDLQIKPSDEGVFVDPNALAVNKIDLVAHWKTAISKADAQTFIYRLLQTSITYEEGKIITLKPVGHCFTFDRILINEKLFPDFDKYVGRRGLDTQSNAEFLKEAGVTTKSGSLSALAEEFGISSIGAHTAMGDVLMTLEVLKKQLSLIQNLKNSRK